MRQSFWDKRFPTILGLFIISIALVTLTYATKSQQLFELGAAGPLTFEDIRVSNQTGTSLSISFQTSKTTGATLRLGETLDSASTLFDDRDEIGSEIGQYKMHHFTAKNLRPGQQYRFSLLVQSTTFDNEGGGFVAKTASTGNQDASTQVANVEPVRGTVVAPSGQGAKDTLVFVKIDGATLLSTVVKSQGEFLVPLTDLLTSDLTGFYVFKGDEILSLEIVGEDGRATVVAPFGMHADLGQIVLGEHVDLTVQEAPTSQLASPTGKDTSGFTKEALPAQSEDEETQTFINPQDGEFLIDPKPLFRGKGIPFQKVEILIESEPQEASLIVDENGEWFYQPDVPLASGEHTVSVHFFEGETPTKILTRQFEVLASGTQVVEAATSSPSPTSRLTPVSRPTATPSSISATPSGPTAAPIPTSATVLPGIVLIGTGIFSVLAGFLAFHAY